jgi:hypothetical protein
LLLVRAYARYLCRKHHATSVELIRRHREAISPVALSAETPQDGPATVLSTYGEFPR